MARALGVVGGAALTMVVTALLLLNTFAGIASGVWLAIQGQWALVGMGLALSLGMPLAWGWITMPGLFLTGWVVRSAARGGRLSLAGGALIASLYNYGFLLGWMLLIFIGFTREAGGVLTVPLALWIYATTTSPLCYMASKEPPDSTGSTLGCLYAEMGIILLVLLRVAEISLWTSIVVVGGLAVAACLGVATLAVLAMGSKQRPNGQDMWGGAEDVYL